MLGRVKFSDRNEKNQPERLAELTKRLPNNCLIILPIHTISERGVQGGVLAGHKTGLGGGGQFCRLFVSPPPSAKSCLVVQSTHF